MKFQWNSELIVWSNEFRYVYGLLKWSRLVYEIELRSVICMYGKAEMHGEICAQKSIYVSIFWLIAELSVNGLSKRKAKVYDTRYSQAVTHPSTNRARRCLTSVIGREPVLSTWYGRRRFPKRTDAIWLHAMHASTFFVIKHIRSIDGKNEVVVSFRVPNEMFMTFGGNPLRIMHAAKHGACWHNSGGRVWTDAGCILELIAHRLYNVVNHYACYRCI